MLNSVKKLKQTTRVVLYHGAGDGGGEFRKTEMGIISLLIPSKGTN